MIFYATCLTAVLKQDRNLFLLYSALYIKINVKIIKLMQKRSSQLNMQLTQLRKENTSIAEVRVWIPASLNFLRLSFCNCITISAFTSSSCSSNIWNSCKFIIQLFTFNMVDSPCGLRVLMLFQFHQGLVIILCCVAEIREISFTF